MICARCDVGMRLGPMYEGSSVEAWYCPCCKARLRTAEMIERDAEARRADLGLTKDENDARLRALVRKQGPTRAELEAARRLVARMSDDWEPPCEHVNNPWQA